MIGSLFIKTDSNFRIFSSKPSGSSATLVQSEVFIYITSDDDLLLLTIHNLCKASLYQ